jgi:hypothetical protein
MRFRRKLYCEAVAVAPYLAFTRVMTRLRRFLIRWRVRAVLRILIGAGSWRRIFGWRFQPKRAWKSHSALTQAPCSIAGIWLKLAGRADEEGAVFHLPTGINLAARLWIDLKHADVQSLGQRLQEVETHSQLLLYVVWQNHLVLHAPLPSLFCLHFLGELVLFIR